uniref:Uncharacterized protein n=1 Tax=Setaria italica TaxID=4555 RepID=K3XQD7_SETIT
MFICCGFPIPIRPTGFRSADFITAATKIIALFWEDIQ